MQRWKLPELTILRRLLLIAAPAGIVALVVWILSPSDPRYNGKRLSSYLDELGPATLSISLWPSVQIDPWQPRPPEQDEAVKALNALGPKALPLVRDWLQSESSLRNKLRKLAAAPGSRFTWLWRWRWMAKDPRAMAYRAICIIPQDGMPVVPVLRTQILSGGPQALIRVVPCRVGTSRRSTSTGHRASNASYPVTKSTLERYVQQLRSTRTALAVAAHWYWIAPAQSATGRCEGLT